MMFFELNERCDTDDSTIGVEYFCLIDLNGGERFMDIDVANYES